MRHIIILVLLLLNLIPTAESHLDWYRAQGSIKNRSRRDISCLENLEYAHGNICCFNCPAGTFVKKPCTIESPKGLCVSCEFDTYTEHGNGLLQCISCTKCRSDQDTVEKCTSTQNTQCVCKQGSFCQPDQACEVCKKCSKCKEDEELVESCTVTSNTVCRKIISSDSSFSVIFLVVLAVMAMLVVIVSIIYWKRSKSSKKSGTSRSPKDMVKICMGDRDEVGEERQNAQNSMMEESSPLQPFLEPSCAMGTLTPASSQVEKDRGLGDSLPNTANSSQTSLAVSAVPCDPQPSYTNQPSSSALAWLPHTLEHEPLRKLVPLNGEESLKKTFDFFEDMDVHYHNRFFRYIGLSDNAIKSTESLFPNDRVYELLKIWLEKEGMKADFNNLIEALIYLDQRLSAENIIAKAISNDYFKHEDE